MQELISKLTERAGITEEQAEKVLDTIKDFVKDKFPMMAGAVENLLPGKDSKGSSDKNPLGGFGPDILD
jgi:hypothetical protein